MFKVGDKVKLEDLPLVEVRDYESDDWIERRLLANVEGLEYPIKVININGGSFGYKFMRPIQEPKVRPMTDMEIIEALKKEGCALKDDDGVITYDWRSCWAKESHTITYDFGKTWGKLEVEG